MPSTSMYTIRNKTIFADYAIIVVCICLALTQTPIIDIIIPYAYDLTECGAIILRNFIEYAHTLIDIYA